MDGNADVAKIDLKQMKEDQKEKIQEYNRELQIQAALDRKQGFDKYWSDSKRDIFITDQYKVDLKPEFLP